MAEDLHQKLDLARARERAARARVARLRRSLDGANRRTANQVKYTLGAAVVALAESEKSPQMVDAFRRWLAVYLSRPQDRAVLAGTPFELSGQDDRHDAA